jgi:hypothetical protein
MFLTLCSPIGSKPKASFFSTSLTTLPETQIAPGIGELLKPCRDNYSLAQSIIALDDDLTQIDAYTGVDPLVLWDIGIALGKATLEGNSALHRIHDAGELREWSIAGELEDATVVLLDFRLEQLFPVCPKPVKSPGLVLFHQGGIAHDICREDRRKPPFHDPPPPRRRHPSLLRRYSFSLRCSIEAQKLAD